MLGYSLFFVNMKNNSERKNKLEILCLACAKLGEENFCTVPCHAEQYETPPNFIENCFSYFWDCLEAQSAILELNKWPCQSEQYAYETPLNFIKDCFSYLH